MKRKELTKTFMVISNLKKPLVYSLLHTHISALKGLNAQQECSHFSQQDLLVG